jgi:hypothetical protein
MPHPRPLLLAQLLLLVRRAADKQCRALSECSRLEPLRHGNKDTYLMIVLRMRDASFVLTDNRAKQAMHRGC